MSDINLIHGDCLIEMDKLIDKGIVVDAIITDPPYGTTACSWDSIIPFNNYIMQLKSKRSKKLIPIYKDEYILQEIKKGSKYEEICNWFDKNSNEGMWQKLNKLIKPNGAIVLFGNEPFSSALRMSNIKMYKYDFKWEKQSGANFLNLKYQPSKVHEDVTIFGKMATSYSTKGTLTYNPQMEEGKPYSQKSGMQKTTNSNSSVRSKIKQVVTENNGYRYPRSIKKFHKDSIKLFPTQKPVALMEYLIKTYTNENELVLDFTMGSGTTGVACKNLNRNFIGIEKEEKYYKIACERCEVEINK